MSLLLPSGRGSSSHNEYMISNTVLTMDWPEALYLAQSDRKHFANEAH